MMKLLAVIGCLLSFVGAGIIHFWAEKTANLKTPFQPLNVKTKLADELNMLNIFRLLAFGVGIVLLILSIKLLSDKKEEGAYNPEVLDE